MDFRCNANTKSKSFLRKGSRMTSGSHLMGCATLMVTLAKKLNNNNEGQIHQLSSRVVNLMTLSVIHMSRHSAHETLQEDFSM